MAEQVGAEDHVPGNAGEFGHVQQQRDVAVGQRADDEAAISAGSGRGRRPARDAGGASRRLMWAQVGLGQAVDAELGDQAVERGAVQGVERGPGLLAFAHAVHGRVVGGAPGIDQGGPVGGDALGGGVGGEVGDQAGAPVDDGAEGVEHDCHGLFGGHVESLPDVGQENPGEGAGSSGRGLSSRQFGLVAVFGGEQQGRFNANTR